MSNMSYCRFRNTLSDLRDCQETLNGEDGYYETKGDLSKEELSAALSLIRRCREIVERYDENDTILNRDAAEE
jgi:hypothetical protein